MRTTTFQFMNHTINVEYKESVIEEGEAVLGYCQPVLGRIQIATIDPESGRAIPEAIISHSLHHEIIHYMFYLCGRMDLFHNEKLVDMMGGLLAQYIATMQIESSPSGHMSHLAS